MKKTVFALAVALCGCFAIPAASQQVKEAEQPVLDKTNPFKNKMEKKVSVSENDANGRIVSFAKPENMQLKAEKRRHQRQCGDQCGAPVCAASVECQRHEGFCAGDGRCGICVEERCGYGNPFAGIQLTETQKTKVEKARTAQKEKCRKLREKMDKERAKAESGYMKELQKILTPEQMAKYKANSLNVGYRINRHGRRGHAVPGKIVKCPAPMTNYGKCEKTE